MSVSSKDTRASSSGPDDGDGSTFEDLVEQLTDLLQAGDAADVESFLGRHPAQAERLRRLISSLELMADLGQASVLEASRAAPPPIDPAAELGELGDFRLIRELGRGGMGVVYEARQISLNRRVALKTLPFASAVDPKHVQRFHVEAQAAALLHHANIVPVYSVGCERGVHYYAMQFIDGRTLAELIKELRRLDGLGPAAPAPADAASFALADTLTSGSLAPLPASDRSTEEHRPSADPAPTVAAPPRDEPTSGSGARAATPGTSTRSRAYARSVAALGQQATEALEYAHQQGILHRDIKPANLMLDARGTLWVADFGLARFQGQASLTITGDLMGTLRYMSPEQAMAKRVVIDHRTDVYSLGVTLYELLALRPAIDGGERGQILRRIAEQEPPPLHRLNPAVPRDLETIVSKAMAKEASERYDTAGELAEDLRRFLDGQTIRARRPSLLDRAAKWSRRHRAAVATGIGMLVLAVVGLILSNQQIRQERRDVLRAKQRAEANYRRAQQEAERSNHLFERAEADRLVAYEINQFLTHTVLGAADPVIEPDRDVSLRTVLDRASASIDSQFFGPLHVKAGLQRTIGETYRSLGLYEQAEQHFEQALGALREAVGGQHPDTLEMVTILATLYQVRGCPAEAEPLLVQALEICRRVQGEEHYDTMQMQQALADIYRSLGRPSEAEELLVRALEARRRADGSEVQATELMASLGDLYQSLGRPAEAEPLLVRALKLDISTMERKSFNSHRAARSLLNLYRAQGRAAEAEPLLARAAEISNRSWGDDHPVTLEARAILADLYRSLGRFTEAEPLYQQVLEASHRVLGPGHASSMEVTLNLAEMYLCQGRPADEERLLTEALAIQRRVFPRIPSDSGLHSQEASTLSHILVQLGHALLRQEKYAEAEPLLREYLMIREKSPNIWQLFNVQSMLGGSLAGQGAFDEAEPLLLSGYEGMKDREQAIPTPGKIRLIEAAERLVRFYDDWGKPEQAADWRKVAAIESGEALLEDEGR